MPLINKAAGVSNIVIGIIQICYWLVVNFVTIPRISETYKMLYEGFKKSPPTLTAPVLLSYIILAVGIINVLLGIKVLKFKPASQKYLKLSIIFASMSFFVTTIIAAVSVFQIISPYYNLSSIVLEG